MGLGRKGQVGQMEWFSPYPKESLTQQAQICTQKYIWSGSGENKVKGVVYRESAPWGCYCLSWHYYSSSSKSNSSSCLHCGRAGRFPFPSLSLHSTTISIPSFSYPLALKELVMPQWNIYMEYFNGIFLQQICINFKDVPSSLAYYFLICSRYEKVCSAQLCSA